MWQGGDRTWEGSRNPPPSALAAVGADWPEPAGWTVGPPVRETPVCGDDAVMASCGHTVVWSMRMAIFQNQLFKTL